MSTTVIDAKITAYIAARPWLKMVLIAASFIMGTGRARGWFALRYGLSLLLALLVAPQAFGATAVKRVELYAYNLNATTETFFVLGPSPGTAGTALIQATASTTVTAVSGTPFASISVGDSLTITNSDGVVYTRAVHAKASSTSITVDQSLTLTNASFKWRKLSSGTTAAYGSFPVDDLTAFTVQVSVEQMVVASGGISIRLQCRANPSAAWAPAFPTSTPPADNTPFTATTTGAHTMSTSGSFDSCRVGLKLSGSDDASGDAGSNAERVFIYVVGGPR